MQNRRSFCAGKPALGICDAIGVPQAAISISADFTTFTPKGLS
jgi:hypothetical protein